MPFSLNLKQLEKRTEYRPEIDGLRALAVIAVVAFHAFPARVSGGFIGVDVFFVISGYLITSHIFKDLDNHTFSFIGFFGRRIRRIFPALVCVMGASLIFGWYALLADEYMQLGKHVLSGATFLINFIIANESGYFDNIAETKPMLHLWSLAVEEQFYIIWPILIWVAWKNKVNILSLTVLIWFISFFISIKLIETSPIHAFYWPIGRFWELLSGSILAWFTFYQRSLASHISLLCDRHVVRIIYAERKKADGTTFLNLMSFIGAALLLLGVFLMDKTIEFPGLWAVVPVLGAILIISSGSKVWLKRVLFMNPVAIWLGVISYPLYLWHWPILSFSRIIEGETINWKVRILAVCGAVLCAWLTYKFIEKPLRFGGYRRNKIAVVSCLMLMTAAGGAFIYKSEGLSWRHGELSHIIAAKNDWAYPDGLVKHDGAEPQFWQTSHALPHIVFLGDSHIEQYAPRIVDLYKEGKSREGIFVTGGGCPPIPNVFEEQHKECAHLLQRFEEVLVNNPIDTIVIGASFNSYISDPSKRYNDYEYFFKKGGDELSLFTEDGVLHARTAFYDFVKMLSQKYHVVVLLDNPLDQKFSPDTLLHDVVGNRPIFLSDMQINAVPFHQDTAQKALDAEMRTVFAGTKVEVLPQADLICPRDMCYPLSEDGIPKYKDLSHLRPWFVKQHMHILDHVVLKP